MPYMHIYRPHDGTVIWASFNWFLQYPLTHREDKAEECVICNNWRKSGPEHTIRSGVGIIIQREPIDVQVNLIQSSLYVMESTQHPFRVYSEALKLRCIGIST